MCPFLATLGNSSEARLADVRHPAAQGNLGPASFLSPATEISIGLHESPKYQDSTPLRGEKCTQ